MRNWLWALLPFSLLILTLLMRVGRELRLAPPAALRGSWSGEVNGIWGAAQEVPSLAALNAFGFAAVNAISCGSAGSCGR